MGWQGWHEKSSKKRKKKDDKCEWGGWNNCDWGGWNDSDWGGWNNSRGWDDKSSNWGCSN